jgi:hypothetical protein
VCKQPSPREGLVQADIRDVQFPPLSGNIHSLTFISLFFFLISSLVLKDHLMPFPVHPH